jgi:peptidoglycan/xylan/chitin deacetylase (PgdA/CDA1 family)
MKNRLFYLILLQIFFCVSPLWATESAVVLMYHRIGEDDFPSTNVRIEQFEEQLDYLKEHHFQVWPLAKIVEHLQQRKPLPDKTIAITLDDAYLSIYTEAFPRFKERGWSFTVFVSTDPVDQGFSRYMNWEQLREMKKAGITLANHGASHAYLIRKDKDETLEQWRARIKADIEKGQRRLEQELGNTPMLFAYPYGEYNEEVLTIIKELGYSAFGQHSGAIGFDSDPLALARYPINEHYSEMSDFALKVDTLPLPVTHEHPRDPERTNSEPPRLEITVAENTVGLAELSCYASGEGRMGIEWISKNPPRFAIQAISPLPSGRSRYSCTAPTRERRYQWYSHLWITP